MYKKEGRAQEKVSRHTALAYLLIRLYSAQRNEPQHMAHAHIGWGCSYHKGLWEQEKMHAAAHFIVPPALFTHMRHECTSVGF